MALLSTVAGSYVPPSTITTILREELMETVTITDPYIAPVLDLLPTGSVNSPVYQWIVDSLPGLVLNNPTGDMDVAGINVQGIKEGFEVGATGFSDANYPYSAQPVRLTNFVQTWAGQVRVSDRLKRSNVSGIRDPYNNEVMKVTKVIRKAMERRLFDNVAANASATVGSASDPSRTKYLFEWVSGTYAINQSTIATTISADAIDVNMEACTTAGARPTILALSVGSKADLSRDLRQTQGNTSNVINQSNINASERRIIRNVDFYEGDYGTLSIMTSLQIPQASSSASGGKAWLLDPTMLEYVTFAPVEHIPLAKTGHNTKGLIVGEGGFVVKNPRGLGVINGVTT